MLNIKQLKELIKDLPDDADVLIAGQKSLITNRFSNIFEEEFVAYTCIAKSVKSTYVKRGGYAEVSTNPTKSLEDNYFNKQTLVLGILRFDE